MNFANVNIGTSANSGTGDNLRAAFDIINQNFANVAAATTIVPTGVSSVAGRTGAVILGAGDVAGVATSAQLNAVYTTITAANVASQSYTMSRPQDWQPIGPVYTVQQALDQLAFRLKQAGY